MNNTYSGPLNSPGFMAYAILLVVITLVAGAMIGLMVVALTLVRSIPRPLRLFLINLLLAGLVVAVSVVLSMGTSAVLVAVGPHEPRPPYLCRVYLWLYGVGAVARLWNLAAFSLSILAIVRFGKKTISKCYAALFITILWIVPLVINFDTLIPYVFESQFVQGVGCFPDTNRTLFIEAQYTLFTNWAISGGIIPLTISIAVPIVCICYIKRNVVTEEGQYMKGIAKFSLFLVAGGVIGILGQLIPGAIAYYSEAPGLYLSYGFATVSLLPTPIIIIAYLKPVQEQVKKMFTCGKLTKATKELKVTRNTSETGEVDYKT